jgi:hypothetical protein
MSRSHGSGRGCTGHRSAREFGLAHQEWFSDGGVSELRTAQPTTGTKPSVLDGLADAAWQPDLQDTLRSLAKDYDEIAKDIERGAAEVRHVELLDE